MAITFDRKLDSGAFADVWLASDDLGRQVAVKLISTSAAEVSDARQHATALARATHTNVVQVFNIETVTDPDTSESVDAIVMEYLPGTKLDSRLQGEKFSAEEARNIGIDVIDGLQHIHTCDLVHGDLHGGNVMIVGGQAKIIDILYNGSLASLTTQTQEMRVRSDMMSLRFVLQNILTHSELDFSEATNFNNRVANSSSFADVKAAFEAVASPKNAHDVERLFDNAYRRFQDADFVAGADYAAALLGETHQSIFKDLLLRVIDDRAFRYEHSHYVRSLFTALDENAQREVASRLGEQLEADVPGGDWMPSVRFLQEVSSDIWHLLSPAVRIRFEHAVLNDILAGRYDIYGGGVRSGKLGTYASTLWTLFPNKSLLIENLCSMLSQDWYTQNYAAKYFFHILGDLVDSEEDADRLKEAIQSGIRNDATILKSSLAELPKTWREEF